MLTYKACVRAEQIVEPAYGTDLGGIRVRLLDSVVREACEACGDATVEIPDQERLVKVVAMARALVPIGLSGREVRFMQIAMEMTDLEFAETILQWDDSGSETYDEKPLRRRICAHLHGEVPWFSYENAEIEAMEIRDATEADGSGTLVFRRVERGGSDALVWSFAGWWTR